MNTTKQFKVEVAGKKALNRQFQTRQGAEAYAAIIFYRHKCTVRIIAPRKEVEEALL
jgi:hypothetical protein